MKRKYGFDNYFMSDNNSRLRGEYFGRIYKSTILQWKEEGLSSPAKDILLIGTTFAKALWEIEDSTFGYNEEEMNRAIDELVEKEYAIKISNSRFQIRNDKRIAW